MIAFVSKLLFSLALVATPATSPMGDRIVLYGDGQTACVMQNFAQPLGIAIVSPDGQPVAGVVVTLTVESGTASILQISRGDVAVDGQSATTSTDGTGTAVVVLAAGAAVGEVRIVLHALPDAVTSPNFEALHAAFTLFVDTPDLLGGDMPDTGAGDLPVMTVIAACSVGAGALLLVLRRRSLVR